ncbi:hypothetical protein [Chitinophaga agri]|uniref:RHS repeat protein n=1 Tax=Chitinophaga agri TaxID=2703787 RepID=A0A6B9ZA28_9BACT|nr:hypothetical protein [Chitinophaga agri]QHS58194.1 hypothetical protein GWR21_00865 [Chitinophaga agri]
MKSYMRIVSLAIILMSSNMDSLRAQNVSACTCDCLKPFFDYLISSRRLFIQPEDDILVSSLLEDARRAGYMVSYTQCQILARNTNGLFYAKMKSATSGSSYKAVIGDCTVSLTATGAAVTFNNLVSNVCDTTGIVSYRTTTASTLVAKLKVDSCTTCNDVTSAYCYSAITEHPVNPYRFGLAGNWRPFRSYAYYGERKETDPLAPVSLRSAGTINSFKGFWKFTNGQLKGMPENDKDTAVWVWNSELTMVNRKGLELENHDPLGRYNAGLYGYDDALPVAAAQNARYREIAYEGFEDYDFGVTPCDGPCKVPRSFDFSYYKSKLDTAEQHTGLFSLRVDAHTDVAVSAPVVATADDSFGLTFSRIDSTRGLLAVNTDSAAILPSFSPIAGKTIVISAWVKESVPCRGNTYTGNQLGIVVKQAAEPIGSTITAQPQGAIIEGWQRYEEVVMVPEDAVSVSIVMSASADHAVYFDDVRIHPYNANMKSYVYDRNSLRLMAELDENNYATFYEYDEDGTMIRLKKETERGIKTISETRSALLKENPRP